MRNKETKKNTNPMIARMHSILAVTNGYVLAMVESLMKNSHNVSFFVINRFEMLQTLMADFVKVEQISDVIFVTKIPTQNLSKKADLKSRFNSIGVGLEQRREREMMRHAKCNTLKMAMIAIVSLSVVFAQGTPKLDIHMVNQKVNLTDAEKKDASIITYAPGDTIKYIITASNVGDGLMSDPEIVDPVPAGVTYIAKSAMGDNTVITFSIDQGNVYIPWPPTYTVRNANGILMKRKATPDMISHIKWSIQRNLNPGDTSALEFLVVVNK